jgi:voltage-gated potassium channel
MMKKIALFGYGKNGKAVAKEIDKKELVIVVFNEISKKEAEYDGFLNIEKLSDEILDNELVELGIENFDIAICVLEEEARNLFLTLSIRELNKKIELISVTENRDYVHRYKLAGVNQIISPNDIVAKRINTILKKPITLEIIHDIVFNEKNRLIFSELKIIKNSFLDKKYINDIDIESEYNLIIIGILDKERSNHLELISSFNHKIDGDDVLVVVADKEELERLKRDMEESVKWHLG